jgi:hypothetical protein
MKRIAGRFESYRGSLRGFAATHCPASISSEALFSGRSLNRLVWGQIGDSVAFALDLRCWFFPLPRKESIGAQRQEHRRQIGIVREHAKTLRRTLADAQQNESVYLDKLTNVYGVGPLVIEGETAKVAWELADAPIP